MVFPCVGPVPPARHTVCMACRASFQCFLSCIVLLGLRRSAREWDLCAIGVARDLKGLVVTAVGSFCDVLLSFNTIQAIVSVVKGLLGIMRCCQYEVRYAGTVWCLVMVFGGAAWCPVVLLVPCDSRLSCDAV